MDKSNKKESMEICKTNCKKGNEKQELLGILHSPVRIAGTEQTVMNAVKIYSRSVFEAIELSDADRINFIEL